LTQKKKRIKRENIVDKLN
jgi:hypothetical protein